MNQVPNVLALAQQQRQAEAAIQMEVRKVAMDIYAKLAAEYLRTTDAGDMQPDPKELTRLARLAERAAPYLHQHYGAIKIDEEKHWNQ